MEMQQNKSSNSDNIHWLDIVEKLTVAGSIGGSIIGIFLQKSLYASLPISAALAINLLNRQRIIKLNNQSKQEEIAALIEQQHHYRDSLETLEQKNKAQNSDLVSQLKSLKNSSDLTLLEYQNNINNIEEKIEKFQQSLLQLNEVEKELDTGLSNLNQQQEEINKVVKELKVFGTPKQNPVTKEENSAEFYYERAMIHQNNRNLEQAVNEYEKAIKLNNNYAEAYHQRGLIYFQIEEKRKAAEDLRQASQLYFDKQDLDKYNNIRNLVQKLYHIDDAKKILDANNKKIAVQDLFTEETI